jgi:hypothetical protein
MSILDNEGHDPNGLGNQRRPDPAPKGGERREGKDFGTMTSSASGAITTGDQSAESAAQNKIMYVCESCFDGAPEGCGHFDRTDLRMIPDGTWLCEICYDELSASDVGIEDEDERKPAWSSLAPPPQYVPSVATNSEPGSPVARPPSNAEVVVPNPSLLTAGKAAGVGEESRVLREALAEIFQLNMPANRDVYFQQVQRIAGAALLHRPAPTAP